MRKPTGPQSNGTGPDDRRPPRHPADDLARLADAHQRQAETHQAQTRQLRHAPWWALLAGVCLMALVAGWLGAQHTAPPFYDGPAW